MTPDDSRHGEYKGYVAGCRQRCCLDAYNAYRKQLKHRWHQNGGNRLRVNAIGYRRRVQALQVIGWPLDILAAELGINKQNVNQSAMRNTEVTPRKHQEMVNLYNRLSMTAGPSVRAKNYAKSRGWAPPLAWDDETIDNPEAKPFLQKGKGDKERQTSRELRRIDHVVIELAMQNRPVKANKAERAEVIRLWMAEGRELNELERIQGWNPWRDMREAA